MSVHSDLAYVADALRRRETDVSPWPIQVAWAIYTAVGFTFVDFLPLYCSWWFFGAGIANMVFCVVVGKRYAREMGDDDSLRRRRVGTHWSACFLGIIPLVFIVNMKHVDPPVISQLVILVIGIVYFLAGVHFDRRYYPLAYMLLIGSVVTGLPAHGIWTGLGVLVGAGLVALAFVPRKDPAAGRVVVP